MSRAGFLKTRLAKVNVCYFFDIDDFLK